MAKRVVITGVTGLVGGAICRAFMQHTTGLELFVVVRPSGEKSAEDRWHGLVKEWSQHFADLPMSTPVGIIDGDLITSGPALARGIAKFQPDMVIHAAAQTRFDQSLNEAWEANVEPIRHLLAALEAEAPQCRFVYLSTAFVAGSAKGLVSPVLRRLGSFRNHYERSKWIGEMLVASSKIPWLILRPSIVVGDSRNGYTPHFRVFYALLKIWLGHYIERSPCDLRAEVDCVPVDYIATATLQLAFREEATQQVLHLCAGSQQITARSLMHFTQKTLTVVCPKTYPLWCANFLLKGPWRRHLPKHWQDLWELLSSYVPYMLRRRQVFDTSMTDQLLSFSAPSFAVYGGKILEFCKNKRGGIRAPQ